MEDYKLGEQETRFADIIWDNAPIKSPELVELAAEVMQWKNPLHTPCYGFCGSS